MIPKKIVTLYVDDSSLRLLVVQGKRVKKWAELALEPGLVKANVVADEIALSARIKQLLKTQKVRARKVILGLSGLHCLTRPVNLPPLPRAMLDEAVMREAKRVLPVPLEQLYLSWQVISASEGGTQVFIVAVPCKTADSMLKALRMAGLKPYMIGLKPLALVRTIREPTAVLVDVEPTEFDIVIVSGGVPQPIRSVPLPEEAVPLKEKWAKLKEELDRTIKFFNSNNPNNVLGSSVPIYVSGELANQPQLHKSLSDEFGFPVQTLTSPKCTMELDPARCMVNVGLALKEPAFVDEPLTAVVNVNALPAPYRPKPLPLLKAVALPSGVAFVGLTILMTTYVQDAVANANAVRGQLDSINVQIAQRQAKKKELTAAIGNLEKALAADQATYNGYAAALKALEKYHERIDGDLHVVTGNLPETTTMGSVIQNVDTLTVQGRATNEEEVLDYARSLVSSGRFSEVTVSTIRRVSRDGLMDFILVLKTKK